MVTDGNNNQYCGCCPAVIIDLRRLKDLSLCRPSPNTVGLVSLFTAVWLTGAMRVDRSDRKLINDAPAPLRIEDRLLPSPVSPLAQLDGIAGSSRDAFQISTAHKNLVDENLQFVMAKSPGQLSRD
jgi:hypothetical protein